MSSRRLLIFLTGLAVAAALLAACGDGDDDVSATDPGTSAAVDDTGGTDGSGDAAGGGGTRAWIAGSWVLQSASGDDGPLAVPAGHDLELTITGPDGITGGAGCNTFNGRINAPFDDTGDVDGGDLAITEMSWTEMGCDALEFESAYLDLLGRVDRWELAPPTGLVFRGDGIELVYGVAAPPAEVPLEGTTWILDTVFDGEGMERTASTVRLDKPDVTLQVDDGVLTLRSEGCTAIEAPIEADPGTGGSFTVDGGDALAEQVDCEDPESNLVVAAGGVAISTGYQSFDGRLTLIGLPGETLSFRAADG